MRPAATCAVVLASGLVLGACATTTIPPITERDLQTNGSPEEVEARYKELSVHRERDAFFVPTLVRGDGEQTALLEPDGWDYLAQSEGAERELKSTLLGHWIRAAFVIGSSPFIILCPPLFIPALLWLELIGLVFFDDGYERAIAAHNEDVRRRIERAAGKQRLKPDGTNGGKCYGNMTCNDGLDCRSGHCRQREVGEKPGTLGGPCYGNGTCNDGLSCSSGRCRAAPTSGVGQDSHQGEPTTSPAPAPADDVAPKGRLPE